MTQADSVHSTPPTNTSKTVCFFDLESSISDVVDMASVADYMLEEFLTELKSYADLCGKELREQFYAKIEQQQKAVAQ